MKKISRVWLLVLAVALGACGLKDGPPLRQSEVPVVTPQPVVVQAPPVVNRVPVASAEIPAPARRPPTVITMPKGDFLEDIGGGTLCTPGIKKERLKPWARLGAHPYSGTPNEAIDRFKEVPETVRTAWKQLVAEKKATDGILKKGDRLCSMMYSKDGKHYRWNHIEMKLDDRAELLTLKYTVMHEGITWALEIPPKKDGGCDNYFWRAEKKKSV